MSFVANIPKHLKEVEAAIDKARRRQWELNAKLHDCDCEYCDRQELELDDEDQKEYDNLEATIVECRLTIKRLKQYKQLHKAKV